jgi:hypothetical protein
MVSFMPWPFYPIEITSDTHCIRRLVGLIAYLDVADYRKKSLAHAGKRKPAFQPAVIVIQTEPS